MYSPRIYSHKEKPGPRKKNPIAPIFTKVNGMIPVIFLQADLWLFHWVIIQWGTVVHGHWKTVELRIWIEADSWNLKGHHDHSIREVTYEDQWRPGPYFTHSEFTGTVDSPSSHFPKPWVLIWHVHICSWLNPVLVPWPLGKNCCNGVDQVETSKSPAPSQGSK